MKKILVVGGASGIGYSLVKDLIEKGSEVFIIDINEPPVEIQKLISKFYKFDLSSIDKIDNLTKIIQTDSFEHLIITAGGTNQMELKNLQKERFFWDLDNSTIYATIQLNLISQIIFISKFMPLFSNLSINKSITLTSSINSLGRYGLTIYSTAKAGLEGFTKSAAEDLSNKGIRINCVLPGSVETPLTIKENMDFEAVKKQTILNRVTQPEDIAEVILLLIKSNAITGQCYICDSGQSLKSINRY